MGEQAPKQPFGVGEDRNDIGRSTGVELTTGTIHDVFGHTNAYVVRPLGGGTRLATALQPVSITPMGARDLTHYQIGDTVLCVFSPECSWGLIIGAAPPQVFDPRLILPPSLVASSCMGFFYDQMHYAMFQNEKLALANFSCGRPLDAVQGDWGFINELGVAVWLGKFMSQMRASDMAKIECFWGDDLVRMFAYNRQLFTAQRNLFEFDDEGECSLVETTTPFMWESLGSYTPGEEVFKKSDQGMKRGSEDNHFEPQQEKQVMAFRSLRREGYVGDLKSDMIALLPPGAEGISKRDDRKYYRGVLDVHYGLDGAFHVRSAKEIVLAKTLMMPVPRQEHDPDDPAGDSAFGEGEKYKPANQYGSGDPQEKKPYKFPESIKDPPGRMVDLWDYQAYLFGKYGLQAVDAHETDWRTPEENEVEIDTGDPNKIDENVIKAGGSGMMFKPFAPLPEFGEVKVDQRDGHNVRYYKARSCIQMMDDGSVSIEDGYGSQIMMSGGHIYLAAPGDLNMRPGRNFVAWAPRDFIAKAGWCAELSAAKKDVRIKAENNMHIMAGDGTKGSMLFENRAVGKPDKSEWTGKIGEDIDTRGIIFKAQDSVIHCLTTRFFAGTTKNDSSAWVELNSGLGKTTIAGGDVGVEATKLYGVIVSGSRRKGSCASQFVINPTNAVLISSLDMIGDFGLWKGCKGGGNLEMDGELKAKQSIGSDASIYCKYQMSANGMLSNNYHNGLGGGQPANVQSEGGPTQARANAAKDPLYQAFEDDTLDDANTGAANKSVWDVIGFSFRKSKEHYKTGGDYKVYETRSQQLYRAFGINKQWVEPVVNSPEGTPTRPHPGQEAWTNGQVYQYAEPGSAKDVDFTKGIAKTREDQTEEGLELTQGSMESQYAITIQEE